MKITQVEIDIVERNLGFVGDNVYQAAGVTGGIVHQGVLRIKTDEGYEGNCIVGQHRGYSLSIAEDIFKRFKPLLIGKNPLSTNNLWTHVNNMPKYSINRFEPKDYAAYAAVDVALWDLKGKILDAPVYSILGGEQRLIPAYGTYQPRHNNAKGYVEESTEIKNMGLSAYKIHPGSMPTKETIKTIDLVRESLGGDFTLMIDPNNTYELEKALKVGEALDRNLFYWYEDPIRWNDFENIQKLIQLLKIPIAMTDKPEFLFNQNSQYMNNDMPQIIRGTTRKLGITGLLKSCAISEAFNKRCEIGTGGNIFFNMANIHVTLSVNNCTFYEYWMPTSTNDFATKEKLELDCLGNVKPFDKAGLGLTLDNEWILNNKILTIK